ncbi:hypothetical protein LLG96_01830 [bacterium]|nr:hypothetical protein [bacterium]
MKKIIFLLILPLIAGCLFPAAVSMRTVANSVSDYTVTVERECDATGIGDIIPDLASIYVEFACDSCMVAEFKGNGETFNVEMVSFSKSKGAMGAYLSSDIPDSQPVSLGYAGRKSDKAIEFYKGKYLVLIQPLSGSSIDGAQELARRIERLVPGETIKPDVYEVLPTTQRVKDSEFYFAGPKSFSLGFSSELANELQLGGAVEGDAAEYLVDGDTVIFVMVRYVGRSQTLSAVNSYINSHKNQPVIMPGESLPYYTVIDADRSENYIAENGDWLYLLMNGPSGGKAQQFFEYLLRGGR